MTDDRFKSLFTDTEFARDKNSDAFKRVNADDNNKELEEESDDEPKQKE